MPQDLPALRDLFMQSRRATFVWEPSSAQALDDFDRQTAGEIQMIALECGTVAGFVSVWEADDFIHHLHVHPAFLRRGIGQGLLRALPDWPARPYRLKCVSRNTAALAFYAANGFMPIGQGARMGRIISCWNRAPTSTGKGIGPNGSAVMAHRPDR
jgi:GNAT superfamily N-acetyltransferase